MSTTTTSTTLVKREVSESCLEFLLLEMVNTVTRSTSNNSNHVAPQHDQTIHFKLEKIGFHVGQKLAERYRSSFDFFSFSLEIWLFSYKGCLVVIRLVFFSSKKTYIIHQDDKGSCLFS
jgi:hypothetical protein